MNSLIWFPCAYDEKHAQLGVVHGVVHGPGPQRWSMDRVHGVVHGPGFMFCIRPVSTAYTELLLRHKLMV